MRRVATGAAFRYEIVTQSLPMRLEPDGSHCRTPTGIAFVRLLFIMLGPGSRRGVGASAMPPPSPPSRLRRFPPRRLVLIACLASQTFLHCSSAGRPSLGQKTRFRGQRLLPLGSERGCVSASISVDRSNYYSVYATSPIGSAKRC
jgi:hypothetical protein